MKKWLIGSVLVVSMLLSVPAWAAWVTETDYGYIVTGTTNTIAIAPAKDDVWVKDIIFSPSGANATATFTTSQVSGDTQRTCLKMTTYLEHVSWPNEGKQFRNFEITLSNASDAVYIHTRK